MMQLIPLRGPHHRCTCWHRDAPGSSRMHRLHHRRSRWALPGRRRSCQGCAGPPHHWSRHAPDLATSRSGCTWCIPPPETDVRAAASSPVSHAARRRGGAPRPGPPRIAAADRQTLLAWTCDTAGQIRTGNHQPRE